MEKNVFGEGFSSTCFEQKQPIGNIDDSLYPSVFGFSLPPFPPQAASIFGRRGGKQEERDRVFEDLYTGGAVDDERLSSALAQIDTRILGLEQRFHELRNTRNNYLDDAGRWELKIRAIEKENRQIGSQIEHLNQRIQILQTRLAGNQSACMEVEDKKRRIDELCVVATNNNAMIDQYKEKRTTAEKKASDLDPQVEQVRQELAEVRQRLDDLTHVSNSKIATFQNRINGLRRTIASLLKHQ